VTKAPPDIDRHDPERPEAERDEDAEHDYGVTPELVHNVRAWLEEGQPERVSAVIADMHAADLADLIEQVGGECRPALIELLRPDFDAEIFPYLDGSIREELVEQLEPKELAAAVAELESDDAIDLIEDLDEEQRREILENLPPEARAEVEQGLTYPEYSAGRLMSREFVAVPQFWTVGKALDYLRAQADSLPEDFYDLFIVDPMHRLVGAAPLSRIMRQRRSVRIMDILTEDIRTIPATIDQEEVAFIFRQYGLVSAPVVDEGQRLIGVITVDDVVDVIDEEAEEDLLKLAGVPDTDIYRAVLDTTKARFSWLAVNLLTAFLAAAVIGLFEGTIQQVVALAALMPIVASMGGNAGTQTMTVAVRALATRELSEANAMRVVAKEALVGCINGAVFAVLVGLVAGLWFGNVFIGIVIGIALIINLFVAGLVGTLIPLGLHRLHIDPAVASGVFLTTVTDVVGFFAFLGLATWILL
jgi:magnesium transporter